MKQTNKQTQLAAAFGEWWRCSRGVVFKVPRVLSGPFKTLEIVFFNKRPFKSLEIEFSIKGLLSPLVQPMGPLCFSGGPFHCCEFL